MSVERSMAVHPVPVVMEGDKARAPFYDERRSPDWEGEWGYQITRVTDSSEYKPGQHLTKQQVIALSNDNWIIWYQRCSP